MSELERQACKADNEWFQVAVDHPYSDPGDGRKECPTCGKFVWRVTHSCKRWPVTKAAWERFRVAHPEHFQDVAPLESEGGAIR